MLPNSSIEAVLPGQESPAGKYARALLLPRLRGSSAGQSQHSVESRPDRLRWTVRDVHFSAGRRHGFHHGPGCSFRPPRLYERSPFPKHAPCQTEPSRPGNTFEELNIHSHEPRFATTARSRRDTYRVPSMRLHRPGQDQGLRIWNSYPGQNMAKERYRMP